MMTETIHIYKAEINSSDNLNGGIISNYRVIYMFPNIIFNIGNIDYSRKYIWRKIFIYNKTNRLIKNLYVSVLPEIAQFNYFENKYQFYINHGSEELYDKEDTLDFTKSHGILELYEPTNITDKFIKTKLPSRENHIIQDKSNIKFLIIYDKLTNNPIGLYNVSDTIITTNYMFFMLNEEVMKEFHPDRHGITTGCLFKDVEVNDLNKFWLGIEFYDTTSQYIIDFKMIYIWYEEQFE